VSTEHVTLLLGRRDEPTDGVVDYCENLRLAGIQRGLSFELAQVDWAEKGWRGALTVLRETAAAWRDRWVLLQFTTLAWSRRGFPLRAPRVLDVLRRCGARPAAVFHDFFPLPGRGIVGNAREYCQLRVLRQLYAGSDLCVFTVPVNNVSWLPLRREKAVFIPVGANCPESVPVARDGASAGRTVAVYGVRGGARLAQEAADIGFALQRASHNERPIRLLLFGRGSAEAEPTLRSELAGAKVTVESTGLLPPDQISKNLSSADVLLFVRGQISTRRGSAIAGIACGLPIVGYSGQETAWPITEAGLLAVPLGDREALAGALKTVLSDGAYRGMLAERSRRAQEKYFSWTAIAAQFARALGKDSRELEGHSTAATSHATRVA
jgi:glycosyltransferase involved in cell wall biosynthesis